VNCIALCLLRHTAMRGPAARDLRGASSRSMFRVVWVDDFVFYYLVAGTPPVRACPGGASTASGTWLCEMIGV
jgi:hypothetical protein